MTRSDADRILVGELLARGCSDREVAARTGVSPSTVGRWRRSWPAIPVRWRPAHAQSYAYLLGLYLGDGCLHVNRRGGVLLRICLSADIRRLFCDACDALGVRWTLSNPRNVSVAHRASVARLDAIGCGKE